MRQRSSDHGSATPRGRAGRQTIAATLGTPLALVTVAATLLAGCPGFGSGEPGLDIPEDAPLCEQVQIVLDGRCVTCHGPVARNSAPEYLRLDRFEPTDTALGAIAFAETSALRAADGTMPPPGAGIILPNEVEILRAWFEADTPVDGCEPAKHRHVHDVGARLGSDVGDAGRTPVPGH